MCLGIPMRVKSIDGFIAVCEARGFERDANLLMMAEGEVQVGDLVMISVGNVVQKMTEQEATLAWEMYDEILQATE